MKGKRGVAFLLCILSIFLLTTGCWDRKELDQVAIAAAIGIDKGADQKIQLTVQIIKPGALKSPSDGGSSGTEKGVWIIKSSGDTVFEAVKNFREKSGRQLFWPHTKVIVIGEKIAKEGILPAIDWFLRDPDMRLRTYVLVTQGEASEIINGDSGLEKIPASHLERMIKDYDILSKSVATNLMDITNMLLSHPSHAVIGRVGKSKSVQGEEEVFLREAGVFRKDKLLGWLNPLETRGYLWIQNKVKGGVIILPCTEEPNQLISLEILKSKSKIIPKLENGTLKYTIEVDVTSNLGEQMGTENLINPEMFTVLETEQGQAVEKEIVTLIQKAQEDYKLDILGLGEATLRELPQEWKKVKDQWEEKFPQAQIEVIVNSKLLHSGMVDSFKLPN
ncbi:MAG TPA: Ger(x)C family spore germination protein [Desulfosporosinus sp.]|nr:Ger(x)C family spore germination protein [Desulfosporosinus sp.]